ADDLAPVEGPRRIPVHAEEYGRVRRPLVQHVHHPAVDGDPLPDPRVLRAHRGRHRHQRTPSIATLSPLPMPISATRSPSCTRPCSSAVALVIGATAAPLLPSSG